MTANVLIAQPDIVQYVVDTIDCKDINFVESFRIVPRQQSNELVVFGEEMRNDTLYSVTKIIKLDHHVKLSSISLKLANEKLQIFEQIREKIEVTVTMNTTGHNVVIDYIDEIDKSQFNVSIDGSLLTISHPDLTRIVRLNGAINYDAITTAHENNKIQIILPFMHPIIIISRDCKKPLLPNNSETN